MSKPQVTVQLPLTRRSLSDEVVRVVDVPEERGFLRVVASDDEADARRLECPQGLGAGPHGAVRQSPTCARGPDPRRPRRSQAGVSGGSAAPRRTRDRAPWAAARIRRTTCLRAAAVDGSRSSPCRQLPVGQPPRDPLDGPRPGGLSSPGGVIDAWSIPRRDRWSQSPTCVHQRPRVDVRAVPAVEGASGTPSDSSSIS